MLDVNAAWSHVERSQSDVRITNSIASAGNKQPQERREIHIMVENAGL